MKAVTIAKFLPEQKQLQLCVERRGEEMEEERRWKRRNAFSGLKRLKTGGDYISIGIVSVGMFSITARWCRGPRESRVKDCFAVNLSVCSCCLKAQTKKSGAQTIFPTDQSSENESLSILIIN